MGERENEKQQASSTEERGGKERQEEREGEDDGEVEGGMEPGEEGREKISSMPV